MRILELTPHQTSPGPDGPLLSTVPWASGPAFARVAAARGHELARLPQGPSDQAQVRAALAGADAVVIAPQSTPQPKSPVDGRNLAVALLDLGREAGVSHVVLVSHFLVGHGVNHRNGKAGTWALRDFEHEVRARTATWTIVRPTWLSQDPEGSYEVRLTQDPLADGLVTASDIAHVIISSLEQPDASRGTTFAVHALPAAQPRADTADGLFGGLIRDFEFAAAR